MIMVAHDQARQVPISLDRLIGSGNWRRTQDQVLMEDQAIEKVEAILHKSLGENRG